MLLDKVLQPSRAQAPSGTLCASQQGAGTNRNTQGSNRHWVPLNVLKCLVFLHYLTPEAAQL